MTSDEQKLLECKRRLAELNTDDVTELIVWLRHFDGVTTTIMFIMFLRKKLKHG